MDKELMLSTVNASHEFRMSRLDALEDALMSGTSKESESILNQVYQKEIERNRNRIIHFLQFEKKMNEEIAAIEEMY
jgi:hypothetical protein